MRATIEVRRALLAIVLAALLAACSGSEPTPASPPSAGAAEAAATARGGGASATPDADGPAEHAAVAPTPASWPHFAVRGRWRDPRALTYRIDPANGPLDAAEFTAAIERALATWRATGLVDLRPAPADEAPWIEYAWRRGRHAGCRPFGVDTSVAHAGPVRRGTFVHFDAGRAWSADGASGHSLYRAALHETGHLLGLDHSTDPAAAMYADTAVDALNASDLAGLASLYAPAAGGTGGDPDGAGGTSALREIVRPDPSDVVVRGAADAPDAEPLLVLRRVAPPEVSDFALLDVDGDGTDELLVWRTDAAAHGEAMIYRFRAGPELAGTIGPLLGIVLPDATVGFETADGARAIVSVRPDGLGQRVELDSRGLPRPIQEWTGPAPTEPPPRAGDLDGDGERERVERLAE